MIPLGGLPGERGSGQRNGQAKRELAVLGFKGGQAAVALNDGLYAITTVAVAVLGGDRQSVADGYLTGIRIPDHNKQRILLDMAGKRDPLLRNFRMRRCDQGIFQSVGDHGAKLSVRQGGFYLFMIME